MKIILLVLLMVSGMVYADKGNYEAFVYFGTSSPTPLASNLISFSDHGASTYYGDVGTIYDNCKKGFKCINIEKVLIAIKDNCKIEMNEGDKWKFNNTSYKVPGVNTIYLNNIKKKLLTIKFSSKIQNKKIRKGIIIYSKEKGIESFTYNVIYNNALESYESYHLLSAIGVFSKKDCQLSNVNKGNTEHIGVSTY